MSPLDGASVTLHCCLNCFVSLLFFRVYECPETSPLDGASVTLHCCLNCFVSFLFFRVYECPETSPLDGASVDFVEQYLSTLASSIMDKQHGQLNSGILSTFSIICQGSQESLRMPAPVFILIVGDVPLLRILRESGLDDMNVRVGWDIHIAVAYC